MDSSGSSIGGGGGGGRRRRRRLQGEAAAEARKLQSSQYKGVVPQPNGRWGAQIYEKHQRVWLGTFDDEAEAAKAYDIASHRIRGRDAVVNFSPLTDDSDGEEILFLSSHSKSEIVGMLRKHTYTDELNQSRHDWQFKSSGRLAAAAVPVVEKEVLFDKAVTPSDVGKLNRLVIPKQLAEKHFPLEIGVGGAGKGVLLNFEDGGGKVWRFRYSYWNSSQSYVLTKGWSRFVKEKRIKAGDVVTFQSSSSSSAGNEVRRLYIDSKPRAAVGGYEMMGGGYSFYPFVQPAVKVVRLFGVNFKIPVTEDGTVGGGGGWYGKRRRSEVEEIQYFWEKRNSAMEN